MSLFCCHCTWISGLATSKEIFLLSSLERSATASSRFCTSMPLIFKEKNNTMKCFRRDTWTLCPAPWKCLAGWIHPHIPSLVQRSAGQMWWFGCVMLFHPHCMASAEPCYEGRSGILGFGTLGALPTRTWMMRSPSRSRPSFAAMLLGSICKMRELWVLCRFGSSGFTSPYFLSGAF